MKLRKRSISGEESLPVATQSQRIDVNRTSHYGKPKQPSPYDVWAAKEIVALVQEATVYKEKIKPVLVIDRKISNTAIGREVKEALQTYAVAVLEAQICQRVLFADSASVGKSVFEVSPDSQAAGEIELLKTEILQNYE